MSNVNKEQMEEFINANSMNVIYSNFNSWTNVSYVCGNVMPFVTVVIVSSTFTAHKINTKGFV